MKSLAHSPAHSRLLIKGSFLLPPILSSQTVCVSESNYFKIPGFLNRCSWECHGISGILHPLVENPATKLPPGRKSSGVRGTVTVSLAPEPGGALKWCLLPHPHRNSCAAFSSRRRSRQTAVCPVLPRQPGQSHHPPWKDGESEGDFLPAGLQGRAGY